MDPQQVFISTFTAVINDDYSIGADVHRYQRVPDHALGKINFLIGRGFYKRPKNLNLKIEKKTSITAKF